MAHDSFRRASWQRRLVTPALGIATLFLLSWQSAAIAAPGTHVVTIEGMKFSPAVVEAHVGDTIVWKNKDFFPHTATAEDHTFDSKEIASNHSWKFKVKKAGTISYICTLHPTMKAQISAK